jgi:hypothetical protein
MIMGRREGTTKSGRSRAAVSSSGNKKASPWLEGAFDLDALGGLEPKPSDLHSVDAAVAGNYVEVVVLLFYAWRRPPRHLLQLLLAVHAPADFTGLGCGASGAVAGRGLMSSAQLMAQSSRRATGMTRVVRMASM